MGSGEMDKVVKDKEPKTPSSAAATQVAQEQTSTPSAGIVNPDWSGFQAYSPMPPHGFMASSPQAHPYMWGVQHVMPPYGTPPHPYVTMYPHGGIYAHPSMPPGSYPFSPFPVPSPNGIVESNTPSGMEMEGKTVEGKEKLPIKRSKGSLGSLNMLTGKDNDPTKTSGASANGACSKSAESGSAGSSEGSDANSQNDSEGKSGCGQDSLEGGASQNGSSQNGGSMSMMVAGAPGSIPSPTTKLNIGMDYWGAPGMHGNVTPAPVGGVLVTAGSRETVQSQPWLQDERELKKQKRKQSNRESARRSRLRKQAECDELAQRADVLKDENESLRSEVSRIRSDYEQLLAENASLKERLGNSSENTK